MKTSDSSMHVGSCGRAADNHRGTLRMAGTNKPLDLGDMFSLAMSSSVTCNVHVMGGCQSVAVTLRPINCPRLASAVYHHPNNVSLCLPLSAPRYDWS